MASRLGDFPEELQPEDVAQQSILPPQQKDEAEAIWLQQVEEATNIKAITLRGEIARKYWVDRVDLHSHPPPSPKRLNTYAVYIIAQYRASSLEGEEVISSFAEDFNDWKERTFDEISRAARRELIAFLTKEGFVATDSTTKDTHAKKLFKLSQLDYKLQTLRTMTPQPQPEPLRTIPTMQPTPSAGNAYTHGAQLGPIPIHVQAYILDFEGEPEEEDYHTKEEEDEKDQWSDEEEAQKATSYLTSTAYLHRTTGSDPSIPACRDPAPSIALLNTPPSVCAQDTCLERALSRDATLLPCEGVQTGPLPHSDTAPTSQPVLMGEG
ncbi:hypothetical protein PMIN01_13425 [Paraphaeosphaeria minitans]|uniref:Uncharacterized protein n=1 Tax=Paraphaeosphaeria minitans TaxID=565426 RepID=A0A9P6G3V3_9PLEO|nr:hypothetical protein PMIN01_13425 [Paraphaeosphaeria minitans]